MQSGRIAPVLRQFFSGNVSAKSATDRDAQNQQQSKQQKDREPSREDALAALDLLTQQEEFAKALLKAELQMADGRFVIVVSNASGSPLRTIRGEEVFRILDAGKGQQTSFRGRILDRRV